MFVLSSAMREYFARAGRLPGCIPEQTRSHNRIGSIRKILTNRYAAIAGKSHPCNECSITAHKKCPDLSTGAFIFNAAYI